MVIKIRLAVPEDLDQVAEVEAECFPEAEAATKNSLKNRINTFPESFFVAELDGRIIGFVNGCVTDDTVISDEFFTDSSHHNKDGAWQSIFGLDVVPEYRKQGIAAMLMNKMMEAASKARRKGLILTCKERLIPYYERFGYVNMGKSKSVHGGAVWYDMILEFKCG